MDRALELIRIMNSTTRNSVVESCKKELRPLTKKLGCKFLYNSYVGWQLTVN